MSAEFVCWKCEKSFPIEMTHDDESICNDCYEEIQIEESHAIFIATIYPDDMEDDL
jgi:DNA-directed RNA polymerase subunit RPC12/RpoP